VEHIYREIFRIGILAEKTGKKIGRVAADSNANSDSSRHCRMQNNSPLGLKLCKLLYEKILCTVITAVTVSEVK
jgi:hypothetical protein